MLNIHNARNGKLLHGSRVPRNKGSGTALGTSSPREKKNRGPKSLTVHLYEVKLPREGKEEKFWKKPGKNPEKELPGKTRRERRFFLGLLPKELSGGKSEASRKGGFLRSFDHRGGKRDSVFIRDQTLQGREKKGLERRETKTSGEHVALSRTSQIRGEKKGLSQRTVAGVAGPRAVALRGVPPRGSQENSRKAPRDRKGGGVFPGPISWRGGNDPEGVVLREGGGD